MTTPGVQPAAALFGSDDSDDPFASLGEEPTSTNDPHSSQLVTATNGSADNGASFFEDVDSSTKADAPVPEPTAQDTYSYPQAYSYQPQSYVPNGNATPADHAASNNGSAYSYNAYAPASQPSQPTSSYSYAPSTTQSPFSNYSPSPAASPYASAYKSPSVAAPPAPATNTPPAQLNRPKVANAYDPPFPVNNSRRSSSRGFPPPAAPVFNPYTGTASPPLPSGLPPQSGIPPPPRPSSTASNFSGYAPPPRPPSTSHYAPPPPMERPLSSASHYAPPPPPVRPPSTSQYAPPAPPIRPPSASLQFVPPVRPGSSSSQHIPPLGNAQRPPSRTASSYGSYSVPPRPQSTSSQLGSPPKRSTPPPVPYVPAVVPDVHHARPPSVVHPLDAVAEAPSAAMESDMDNDDPEGGAVDWAGQDAFEGDKTITGEPEDITPSASTVDASAYNYRAVSPTKSNRSASPIKLSSNPYRTASPVKSNGDVASNPYNYQPSSPTKPTGPPITSRYGPPPTAVARSATSDYSMPPPPPPDPYAPRRQLSNGSIVDNVYAGGYASKPPPPANAYDPYAPNNAHHSPEINENRQRSGSNGSTYSSGSDPYASGKHSRATTNESDYGNYSSRYDYPNNESGLAAPQELSVPTRALYAPSPSLMGTNDPLGRASARIPVISFGFGGKLVTCFHGAKTMSTGFDVALSNRVSTGIDVRTLNKVIPEAALDVTTAFPGPLFGDTGSSPINLVRPVGASLAKTRKTKVTAYLQDRIAEIEQGLGYMHVGTPEHRKAEGRLVLAKMLKIMVDNDGKLSGTAEIDSAVRIALVPRLEDMAEDNNVGFIPLQHPSSVRDSSDAIATTTLTATALDKIQTFLIRGQRKQAYHYALDQQLWAHAMVIASGIDKESWQEVVQEFIKTELGSKEDPARKALQALSASPISPSVNGREGLRAVYGLLTGQGVTSVQELVPQDLTSRATIGLAPAMNMVTPLTPNFTTAKPASRLPVDALANWAETVCMMLSATVTPEVSQTLLALGDQLYTNQWVEAAHVCYLLSCTTIIGPGVSLPPIGGCGHPTARMVLAGSRNPQSLPTFAKDHDPMIFTEILEFALSLNAPAKGQEPFGGLPHLQAYRLLRAYSLVELGHVTEANKYCEAITTAMAKPSPYFNAALLETLKDLSGRLNGAASSDKNTSWISSKVGKTSLDSIGGWLVNKLVAGDGDSPGLPPDDIAKPESQSFGNTFSQYSTISSATPSANPSPQSSSTNLTTAYNFPPPTRSTSAMDNRRKTQQLPRVASASAATTSFAQAHAFNAYQPMSTMAEDQTVGPDDEGQEVTWYGNDIGYNKTPTATNYLNPNGAAPSHEGLFSPMGNIPFSPMPPTQSSYGNGNGRGARIDEDDDMEDLGFGNSKPKKGGDDKVVPYDPGNATPPASDPEEDKKRSQPQRPDPKPQQDAGSTGGKSWLSRWWSKDPNAGPGPVKAKLGQESSFYYDKELKKWVNKTAGADEPAKATPPPPPPSRPQTASPGMSGPRPNGASTPPPRSSSAMDLSAPPKRAIPRARSNLAPTPEDASAPSSASATPPPPMGMTPPPPRGMTPPVGLGPPSLPGSRGITPPPPGAGMGGLMPPPSPLPGRPKSTTGKKSVRSRYVDVFAQEGGSPGA
ncbi:hypothetical protein CYLTODRAFT_405295 [Cylindrobasidium torrendii FP15055 ss-10]|uniref:Protein transport protein sec16 n=1 Tax=Cylindrobasidium torrendii FP15055 ss-10 TaxID=1314674 RepID=A0A0D7AV76_9AGAR|nr:hypothetical protein CYLTODRAFT_405295 [Cylindrobasidium torrendii FP15055 ss-10]